MSRMSPSSARLLSLLLVLLGNTLYALTVKLFLLPAGLISCGTTGLAITVNHLTGIPMTGFILAFNVSMLVLGWFALGKQFALTTVFSSLERLSGLSPRLCITQSHSVEARTSMEPWRPLVLC